MVTQNHNELRHGTRQSLVQRQEELAALATGEMTCQTWYVRRLVATAAAAVAAERVLVVDGLLAAAAERVILLNAVPAAAAE